VNIPVNPTFNQIAPMCQNATVPNLSTISTNVPAIQGTWNPALVSSAIVGTQTYTFTPNAGICANVATMNIQILPNEQLVRSVLVIHQLHYLPLLQTILPTQVHGVRQLSLQQ
jgi:hypothetical protein